MAVLYKEKAQELEVKVDHLADIGQKLREIQKDYDVPKVKTVKPQMATSFMVIKDKTQRKDYEDTVDEIRKKKVTKSNFKKTQRIESCSQERS